MRIFTVTAFCLFTTYVFAGLLPAPPVRNVSVEEQHYLRSIYENHNKLEIVTSNPDGSRTGKRGDILLFNDSETYYLEICISSPTGTVWKGVALSDTP